jgi:hypothetical protein
VIYIVERNKEDNASGFSKVRFARGVSHAIKR